MNKNRVGLGTFPLASVFSQIDTKRAEKIVESFLENGGYFIDTAPLYGFGKIELLLGRVLKRYPRDKYFLITKCGYVDVDGKSFKTVQKSGKYEDVIRECERSLKRLKLDYIDLYLVHSPDKNTPFSETMSALTKLKNDGKIKEIGASNVNLSELKEYNSDGQIKYIQNSFSLINRSIDSEFQKYLLKNKIYLMPYHLLEIGLLTGIAFENFKLEPGDLRENLSYWNKNNQELIFKWVREKLAPISKSLGITIGQLNIAWGLHQKFMGFVIVGTTREDYLKINLSANNIKLSAEVLNQLDNVYLELVNEIKDKTGLGVREFRGLNEKFY